VELVVPQHYVVAFGNVAIYRCQRQQDKTMELQVQCSIVAKGNNASAEITTYVQHPLL